MFQTEFNLLAGGETEELKEFCAELHHCNREFFKLQFFDPLRKFYFWNPDAFLAKPTFRSVLTSRSVVISSNLWNHASKCFSFIFTLDLQIFFFTLLIRYL
jgi:hypothetical protein